MVDWNKLKLELGAIDLWDHEYYREKSHTAQEIAAFQSRQIRRQEIVDKLIDFRKREVHNACYRAE